MAFAWWSQPIWQGFKWSKTNTQAHSGIDLGMPCGSQLTAPLNATVISEGIEPWGGQVNLLVPAGQMPAGYDQNSPYVLSFLHLSQIGVQTGQTVQVGQQIGLSGQPPPGYGSGCHLHFEVTHGGVPPYMGYSPWYPTATSYPESPDGQTVNSAGQVISGVFGGVLGALQASKGVLTGANGAIPLAAGASSGNCVHPLMIAGFQVACVPDTVYNWFTEPLRIFKFVGGVILILIAAALIIIPSELKIAGPALQTAGVATGEPELVAAGGVAESLSGGQPVARVQVNSQANPRGRASNSNTGPFAGPFSGPFSAPPSGPPPSGPPPSGPPPSGPPPGGAPPGGAPPGGAPPSGSPFQPGLGRQKGVFYGGPIPVRPPAPATTPLKSAPATGPLPVVPATSTGPLPDIPVTPVTPAQPVQRAPKTGLIDTFWLGFRRLMSRQPIPDAEVLQTQRDISELFTTDSVIANMPASTPEAERMNERFRAGVENLRTQGGQRTEATMLLMQLADLNKLADKANLQYLQEVDPTRKAAYQTELLRLQHEIDRVRSDLTRKKLEMGDI
jgi:hypothetical protein